MLELLQKINPLKSKKVVPSETAPVNLRQKAEGVLITDRLSEEIKQMAENASGCGFMGLLRTLRLLDSSILKTRIGQEKLISSYKEEIWIT